MESQKITANNLYQGKQETPMKINGGKKGKKKKMNLLKKKKDKHHTTMVT